MMKIIGPIILFFILLFFSFTILPPFERDEILYHLAVPKFWLSSSFISLDFSHFFYYPWLTYFFNSLSLMIKAPFLAHLFHLSFFIATLFLILKETKDKQIANYILLLFITLQTSIRFSYVAYAEFYLLFFTTASFILIKRWYEGENNFNLFLSALTCGLGLNTKYNMLVLALLLYFLVFWLAFDKYKSLKKMIAYGISYIAISFIFFFPFLLKNYIITGNPLYPLLNNIFFSSNEFAFENVSHFLFRKYFFAESLVDILLTPLYAFFYGRENNMQYFDGVLNPFFVIFPIIAVFLIKKKEYFIYLFIGWLYNLFVLFLEPVQARFLLPSLPIFAIISAEGLSKLRLSNKKLMCLFIPFIAFNLFFSAKHILHKEKWLYLFGKISKDEFLERKTPDYKSIKFINENTKKDAKIFYLFSGQRTYYLERDFIYDSFNDGRLFKRIFNGSKDEKEFLGRLKRQGITHLFLRKDLFEDYLEENFREDEIKILEKFFEKGTRLIFGDNVFLVLELD